jgi:hypothetical protein
MSPTPSSGISCKYTNGSISLDLSIDAETAKGMTKALVKACKSSSQQPAVNISDLLSLIGSTNPFEGLDVTQIPAVPVTAAGPVDNIPVIPTGSGATGYSGLFIDTTRCSEVTGFVGSSGCSGVGGAPGATGTNGAPGYTGFVGATGVGGQIRRGLPGLQGLPGLSGYSNGQPNSKNSALVQPILSEAAKDLIGELNAKLALLLTLHSQ